MSYVYTKDQVAALFSLLDALKDSSSTEGCPSDLTVVDSVALFQVLKKAGELKELNQKLLVGQYEHRHGVDTHNFLVPDGVDFSKEDYANWLDDFESGEFVEVGAAELSVIDGQVPQPIQIQVSLETADDCQGIQIFDESGSTGPIQWDRHPEMQTTQVVIERFQGDSVLEVHAITGDQWRELESSGLFESMMDFAFQGHFLECFDDESELHKALVKQMENEGQSPKDRAQKEG
jgi:hypothetical protein